MLERNIDKMAVNSSLTDVLNRIVEEEKNFKQVDECAKEISQKYRANDNDGKRLVTKNKEAVAYALSRMPATYEAVSSCIKNILEDNDFSIDTVLDVGAGTGAATWAVYDLLGDKVFVCLERELEMINVGKKLMEGSSLKNLTSWSNFDIINDCIEGKYDIVVASYMINELPKETINKVLQKLWDATKKVLLILEPGTPKGFSNILSMREILIHNGANIIAPCTHQNKCKIQDGDWCQFYCRVQRSRAHKMLKDGQAPFEDEKYSYIAFSKEKATKANYRILRHPIINKGFSEFKVCCEEGIRNIKLSKKDGAIYKNAKKKSAGDSLNI